MPNKIATHRQLIAENKGLSEQLEKAEASLHEILSGEADALFVSNATGAEIFAIKGTDQAYRTLIESMSEGALTLTPNGLVLYANQRFSEMIRMPLEKVMGSDIFSWFTPESRLLVQTLLLKDMPDKFSKELILAVRDGTLVPVYVSMNRMVLDGGTDAYGMVVTDLTEQKRNEAILAEEKLARAILEQAADAIVICDESGRIIRASKQAQIFNDKDLIGQQFAQAFPLRHLDGTDISPFGSIVGSCQSVEVRLDYNARKFDFLISVGHLKSVQTELLGSVVTLTDITERKQTEATRDRLANILESTTDLVISGDPAGYLMYLNHAAYTTLGLGLEEDITQLKVADFIPNADDNPGLNEGIPIAIREGSWSGEAVLINRSGLKIPVSQVILAHRDLNGKIDFFSTILRDITERKKSEASIKYLNRVLSVLSGINTLIVRVTNCEVLYREACDIAVEKGGFRMAMLVIVDPVTKLPVTITSAGKDEVLLETIKKVMSTSEGMQTTLIAQAIREKTPLISNDTQNDPRLLFGKKYAEAGVNSMTVLPLIISGEAIGALALYASELEFFQKNEMKLLVELAGDIAFAIDHIKKQERLNYLAYYDVLTGLANRTLFIERLAQYMRTAISGEHKLAIFLIDLERFKNINDSLGRSLGDSLLKQVAELLTQFAQDTNRLARIDADHFAFVVAEVTSDSYLAKLLDNMMATFLEHSFILNDTKFRIGIKVGIALFPDDGDNTDILFRNAEAALKKAKASNDRFLFYTKKMTEAVAGQLTLENQLRQAIDNEEFVLHYQPKVNLLSGKVTSAEALIRWNDPRTGLVPPGKFIPVLEETGLIYEVGRWALLRAIEDNLRWRVAGLHALRIAVNVSPLQLRNSNFTDEIKQVISLDEHAADGLELEITESLIMENVKHSISSLQKVRDLGVTIAIDDFGTGFSSLSYLAKLPVDTLKIDRAFVIEMDKPEGLALVSNIIILAHALKLKVVAEGVETEQQSRQLLSLNCDEMQGFLFSKPVPAEIFEAKFLTPLSAVNINS